MSQDYYRSQAYDLVGGPRKVQQYDYREPMYGDRRGKVRASLYGETILEEPLMQHAEHCDVCCAPVDPAGGFRCPEAVVCSFDCARIIDDNNNTHHQWISTRMRPRAPVADMPEGAGIGIGGAWIAVALAFAGYAWLVRPSKRGR